MSYSSNQRPQFWKEFWKYKDLLKLLDSREIGGTQFLGIKKPVIKCHGNSDRLAFRNAVNQAMIAAKSNFTEQLEQNLAAMKECAAE